MSAQFKYTFVFIFLLSITSLTLQAGVLSCMKDGNIVKKQLTSNNISPTEEEEDEDEIPKAEEEAFLAAAPVFVMILSSQEIVWPGDMFLLYHNHLNIQTPPPEL